MPWLKERCDCLTVRKEERQLLGDEIGESNEAVVFLKDVNFSEFCSIQVICKSLNLNAGDVSSFSKTMVTGDKN